jgi:hypothetical protein
MMTGSHQLQSLPTCHVHIVQSPDLSETLIETEGTPENMEGDPDAPKPAAKGDTKWNIPPTCATQI